MSTSSNLLRTINTAVATDSRIRDFVQIARLIAAARGDTLAAAAIAERSEQVSGAVAGVLKSAVGAGTLADANWAAPLSPYASLISAFLGSLRSVGAFDRLFAGRTEQEHTRDHLPKCRPVPQRGALAQLRGATGSGRTRPTSRVSPARS